MTYLTNDQISEMASEALANYELSANWGAATRYVAEWAEEEFGFKPRRSAVLLSVNHARAAWLASPSQGR